MRSTRAGRFLAFGLVLAQWGCSSDSASSRYLLAEKLWSDGKHPAAVVEFEKVVAKDPNGKLGRQALFRLAMTQTLYLGNHVEALRNFRRFLELGPDSASQWEAEKQIGEILFSKTEQYEASIAHYRPMLKDHPDAPEHAELLFRVGRAHFFLWHFDDAIQVYREIMKKHAGTLWAEKSLYEIGMTYFTRGEQRPGSGAPGGEAYQDAIDTFESFLKRYPKSELISQVRFGIASCLEELDQLDAAYSQYEQLLPTYPSPNVIRIKLARIKERKIQRSR